MRCVCCVSEIQEQILALNYNPKSSSPSKRFLDNGGLPSWHFCSWESLVEEGGDVYPRNKELHDEIKRISKESKDVSKELKTANTVCNVAFEVTQGLSKRIVDLEKEFSKSEAKSIAFEIALQHKSRENNSLKSMQKENENFMASLQLENAHLK
ncbi:hypothetical protein Tco_0605238 [Tanacetum coccineum]